MDPFNGSVGFKERTERVLSDRMAQIPNKNAFHASWCSPFVLHRLRRSSTFLGAGIVSFEHRTLLEDRSCGGGSRFRHQHFVRVILVYGFNSTSTVSIQQRNELQFAFSPEGAFGHA